MTAFAGTLLSDVERELERYNQMIPAEPLGLGPLLGHPAGIGTVAGAFVTNLSGARRVAAGSLRDQLLGIKGVNGRGEQFKSGGRVVKNVTGYDVARGLTGSWGTLAVLTEVTFKLLPRPEESQTLVVFGLTEEIAAEAMTAAMITPHEVTAAAHIPAELVPRLAAPQLRSAGRALTLLRLENFSRFLPARIDKLRKELVPYGDMHVLTDAASRALWDELRQVSVMQGSDAPLWRISVAPKQGPKVVADIRNYMPVNAFYDWSGGLIWLEVPGADDAGATDIRRVLARTSGHATLIRADAAIRAEVDVFQPLDVGVARLTAGLKASFDPNRILNPGRMYASL
jgi:glycolate oxidase FAD binding subunit